MNLKYIFKYYYITNLNIYILTYVEFSFDLKYIYIYI